MSVEPRNRAAIILSRIVEEGGFSQRVLASELATGQAEHPLEGRDRAWITRAVYATLTHLERLDTLVGRLVERGASSLPPVFRSHLRIALWEILLSDLSGDPAPVVSAAVESVKRSEFNRLSGLMNAVLRRALRERDILMKPPKRLDQAGLLGWEWGLPPWMATELLSQLGSVQAFEQAMQAFNAPGGVGFRVRQGERSALIDELQAQGLEVEPHPFAPRAGLSMRGNLATTPAHERRQIVIQDPGAQLAIAALPRQDAPRILEVAAGIGGKTLALRDRFPTAEIHAVDRHEGKLAHLARIPELVSVQTHAWEVGHQPPPAELAATRSFDQVIVDAPCSALGTIGRHPEVRWRRQPGDVDSLSQLQGEMLHALAEQVAVGGVLLYIVCTWTPAETSGVIGRFLATHPDFELDPPTRESADPEVDWPTLIDDGGFAWLWPHATRTDGFTFVRLRRKS